MASVSKSAESGIMSYVSSRCNILAFRIATLTRKKFPHIEVHVEMVPSSPGTRVVVCRGSAKFKNNVLKYVGELDWKLGEGGSEIRRKFIAKRPKKSGTTQKK